MSRVAIEGFCPACGRASLAVRVFDIRTPTPRVNCEHPGCPAPDSAARILSDSEIHHIVRFDPDSETFNVKHPLRERVDGELPDCPIHSVIVDMDHPTEGSWRLIGHPPVYIPGGPDQEGDWEWEQL